MVKITDDGIELEIADVEDRDSTIWDSLLEEVPNSALANDSITVSAGSGLSGGGSTALGSSTSLSLDAVSLAGAFLSEDGSGQLDVNLGAGVEGDGSDNLRVDEDYGFNFTSSISATGGIDSLPSPSGDNEAARKAYVDSVAQGLDLKESVGAATDGTNIDLTSTTDPNPIDGYTLSDGERVLLKDQTAGSENGVYVAGTATDPSTWTRAEDFDDDIDVSTGAFVFVENGTQNSNVSFVVTTEDPIAVGTDDISFTVFTTAGGLDAGDGLKKSSQTLNIEPADFAGAHLSDDGSDNLAVDDDFVENSGDTISGTLTATGTPALDVGGDIDDGTQTIWDAAAQEIPDSALGSIANSTLANDSITLSGGDGLKGGSTAALGGSFSLNIEPADFAGAGLQDDGADNLELVNNSITISGGTGITGGSATLGGSVTVSHSDTSTQSNVSAGSGAAITDVNLDDQGHVTSIGTTDLASDVATWTFEEGDGESATIGENDRAIVSGGSNINTEMISTSPAEIEVRHNDTSTQGNVTTGGATVIDDISIDGAGHVTNMNTQNRSLDDWGTANSDLNIGHNDLYNVTEIRDGGTTIRIDDGNTRVEFEDGNNNRTEGLFSRVYLQDGAGWFDGNHAELVGVGSSDHHTRYSDSEASSAAPVQSVNSKTGDVTISTGHNGIPSAGVYERNSGTYANTSWRTMAQWEIWVDHHEDLRVAYDYTDNAEGGAWTGARWVVGGNTYLETWSGGDESRETAIDVGGNTGTVTAKLQHKVSDTTITITGTVGPPEVNI